MVVIGAHADDWPQWLGPQRDGVWRETGIVETFPGTGPNFRWRTAIGSGYAGPAVANGRVYVHDRKLAPDASNPSNPFDRGGIPGTERVLCLNERDGEVLWTHEYDSLYTVSYAAGPRVTPLVHKGRVYALGAEGHLCCLDAETGKEVWSRELTRDYGIKTPTWGFAGHPLVDGDKLICLVGGEGSVAVAFDRNTGKELWRALTAREPGYAPPMVYTFNGRRQLILWHPESVNGLDPETGEVLWSYPWDIRSGMSIPTPRQLDDRLFLTCFYNGSLMLRITDGDPEVLWKSPKASEKDTLMLHSVMSTPVVNATNIFGCCSYGQFRCLRTETGERVWETFEPTTGKPERWGNAFIVQNGGRYFLFNERGDLIIARLAPEGYEEISRTRLIKPDNKDPHRSVVWSHPAFANRSVYARNDSEIVCADLAAD
ncbi:MAG: PQQ-like beta-propeller repeat protein [Verrucomicrobia bacterium]|jgi:outer membrane protein assembly factor BamB|nr:PQQ-like beta-propeller repeat protein [Verrucomicrobiota bacterium]